MRKKKIERREKEEGKREKTEGEKRKVRSVERERETESNVFRLWRRNPFM